MTSEEARQYVKEHRTPRRKFLVKKCLKCGREVRIQTTRERAGEHKGRDYYCLICGGV